MSKVCSIHQPNFLPWIGYFYKMSKCDYFVFLDNVDIEIGTSKAITNRTKIKGPNGVHWITVPMVKGLSKKINEIEIVPSNWRDKLLNTIYHEYKKSNYFESVFPLIEEIVRYDESIISKYNAYGIKKMANHLNIKTNILFASDLEISSTDRNQRIIDICSSLDCSIYSSGKGGAKYHNEDLFKEQNISISYLNFLHPQYNQLHGDFAEGLSVLDFLFSNQTSDIPW